MSLGSRRTAGGVLLFLVAAVGHLSCQRQPQTRQAAEPRPPAASPAPPSAPAAAAVPTLAPPEPGTTVETATRWPDAAVPAEPVALAPFASKDELLAFVKKQRDRRREELEWSASFGMIGESFGAAGLGLSGIGEGGGGKGEGIGLGSIGTLGHGAGAGRAAAGLESVTNTQHAEVDEGGIVKVAGDHLIVLRRGRLFAIRLADLSTASVSDAFGPGIDPAGTWYDEMLISGSTIVVLGYSYARGGTEIGLFDLGTDGRIVHRATHHLRSDDYYSSRNYASRLLGDKLVLYAPRYVRHDDRAPLAFLPAERRWRSGATAADFVAIAAPDRIDRPLTAPGESLALHTVTVCDLSKPDMACTARGVMGPPGRTFYVSPSAVYVWMTPWSHPAVAAGQVNASTLPPPRSLLYRLPLAATEAPTALRTRGAPIDQFSFLEHDGELDVLVRADANGDAMWLPERSSGAVALVRVPLASFSRTVREVPGSAYVSLPVPGGGTIQNRFVGDYVLYGAGSSWGRPHVADDPRVFAYRTGGGEDPVAVALGHPVDRIEPMGGDAVVVGADAEDLHFSSIALARRPGALPARGGRYTRKDAAQGELRSHGFFYRSDGEREGVFGLPVRGGGQPGYRHLRDDSAGVLFVKNDGLRFGEVGALDASRGKVTDDGCRASCVDWYGNAQPLFLRGRVFALLGYELVEGKLERGRITEVRRASFAPRR